MELGKAFANKVGRKFKEADLMMRGENSLELAQLRADSAIPEGETLILQAYARNPKRILLPNDIISIVQNNQLMLSLGEFCKAVDFPIQVQPQDGIANGWFMREDQLFSLDINKNEVTIMGATGKTGQNDIYNDGTDIYVSSLLLEKWFALQIKINLASLELEISGQQPLPIEERELRSRRTPYQSLAQTQSKLPLVEKPYQILNTQKPNLDVALSVAAEKNGPGADITKRANWSVIGSGDLLGMSSQTFIAGDYSSNDKSLEAVRLLRQTFSRDFDNEDWITQKTGLRRAAIGDTNPVNLPIISSGGTGQGFSISSRSSDGITTQSSVDIRGNAQPGWDVELYRNDNVVGSQTVGATGEYLFESVFLFVGNNTFKIILYGPQGEIREETRDFFSSAQIAGGLGGAWDVALLRTNKITYNVDPAETPIDGDLNLSAKYETNVGDLGAARLAFASTPVTNNTLSERKNFVGLGLSSNILGTTVSSDSAYNIEDDTYAATLTARRNFDKHLVGTTLRYSSENFSPSSPNDTAATKTAQTFVSGPLAKEFIGLSRLTYAGNLSYIAIDGGTTTTRLNSSVSGRVQSFFLGAGLQHTIVEQNTGDINRSTGASLTARGNWGEGRWRTTSNYDLDNKKLTSYDGNYTYAFSNELEGQADLRHTVDDKLTQLELSANWNTEQFTLTPRVTMNNQDEYTLTTNMRFGLAENPYSGEYEMFRRNVIDSGGFAGRVFMDKNGDGIYNEGEEVLPDVDIRALQNNRRAATNEQGIAFIADMARGRKTDVIVDTETFPDSYYMTLEDGIAVRPRPGVSQKLDYPVVVSGEMDGTATVRRFGDATVPARNLNVRLTRPDGKIEKQASSAYDGYFDLSSITPGVYFMHVVPDATSATSGYMLPKIVEFKPDGTSLFGNNIKLNPDYRIPFLFDSDGKTSAARKTRVTRADDIEAQVSRVLIGPYKSKITLTVAWYKFRFKSGLMDHFKLLTPISDIVPTGDKNDLWITLMPKYDVKIETAARYCEMLIDDGHKCAVEVLTRFKNAQDAQAPKPDAGQPG